MGMRIEIALRERDRLTERVRGVYSMARTCKWESSKINGFVEEILASRKTRTPNWVYEFVRGYARALNDQVMREVVYGGFFHGVFMSTHSRRADYYQTQGVAPSDWADDGAVASKGFYWAFNDEPVKPFFVSDATANADKEQSHV